jgi:5-methylcytosine-specific restriction endonuclease McrA
VERLVRQRAGGRCEYCRLPQAWSRVPFEIDHIIARKHRGHTVAGNLAVSCWYCNVYKGANLSGLDPATAKVTRLYHPRRHKWAYHFRFDGSTLIGRTAIGRTTIEVLRMNHPQLVALRDILMGAGMF